MFENTFIAILVEQIVPYKMTFLKAKCTINWPRIVKAFSRKLKSEYLYFVLKVFLEKNLENRLLFHLTFYFSNFKTTIRVRLIQGVYPIL